MHVLSSKTSKGELPLRQPSPPPGTRRAHDSDAPFTGPKESSSNPTSQNEALGTIPGSFPKEPPFVGQMERPPKLQQSAFTTSPNTDPPEFALPVYTNELGRLPLHGQVSFGAQARNSQSQTHSSQLHPETDYWYPVAHSGSERSEPAPLAGPSGTSSSYGLHHAGPSAPPLQQQQQQHHLPPHHVPRSIPKDEFSSTSTPFQQPQQQQQQQHLHPHHLPRSIPTDKFPSTPAPLQQYQQHHLHPHHIPQNIPAEEFTSGVSSMAQGQYGMVPPNVAASTSFASTLGHIQPQSLEYELRPIAIPSMNMGPNAMAPPPPPSSAGPSMDNVYSGMAMDPMSASGHPAYHPYQGVSQQGESYYPFALESNTEAVWSNAPTGFECVILHSFFFLFFARSYFSFRRMEKWGAYLGEMLRNGHQRTS
jgi:hypothetical protein